MDYIRGQKSRKCQEKTQRKKKTFLSFFCVVLF